MLWHGLKPDRQPIPKAVAAPLRALFARREATAWTTKELAAYRKLRLTEAQIITDLAAFAKARSAGWDYYRRDTLTLLNNWQAETERAADYLANLTKTPSANANHVRPHQPAPVSRNPIHIPYDPAGLNATAIGGGSGLGGPGGPRIGADGKRGW